MIKSDQHKKRNITVTISFFSFSALAFAYYDSLTRDEGKLTWSPIIVTNRTIQRHDGTQVLVKLLPADDRRLM